ncbi:carboxypeptidase-like regulatory domain-containing protein [Parvularcula maris]|uniref:Carboxypeptidase-like regulatory domain-containing protein n=1 Tax=Parvularcula maris TaxID=2965077 RepID=A0A9X2LDE8_9PROT|nr:carboxypeptidase-like regulatory domain-containing protein [Parvularcula maris]MCQ8186487.1 carboxypeptidase-like regulatory domain-containing protein [Parvularcula maris]
MRRTYVTNPSWLLAAALLVCALFWAPVPSAYAQDDPTAWTELGAEAQVSLTSPRRSRRSSDATVGATITAASTIEGPVWMVLGDLTDGMELQGADGFSPSGDPYVVLSATGMAAGETITKSLVILGGRARFNFAPQLYTEEDDDEEPVGPEVSITSPATLTTVGTQSVEVRGTVGGGTTVLTVNGQNVTFSGGTFSTFVSLEQGLNTIVARASGAGDEETTASIVVSQDLTPPVVTIESPLASAVVKTPTVAVTGLVNDIVRGTVTADEAVVTVNGRRAKIENRTYLGENIPLQLGRNTIEVLATDQVGNVGRTSIEITYEEPLPNRIELVSGQAQSGEILSALDAPLSIKLQNANGSPAAEKMVVFRAIQGDGKVGAGTDLEAQAILVRTDAEGLASTSFRLGSRAGTGNNRVRATASGYDGEVVFYADATPRLGDKVSIIDGNNQRSGPGQPLPKPLTVAVTDTGANLLRGVDVTFKVTKGEGKFEDGSTTKIVRTDGDGRASVAFRLGSELGLDVHRVVASIDGVEARAGFTASALKVGNAGQTKITGVVLDNQDNPIPGVTIRVDGLNRQAVADAEGQFEITGAPVGPVHLIADGSTATVDGEWPNLSYNIVTVSGAVNPLPAPIYMVKLDTENAQMVGLEKVEYTLDEVPGFKLTVEEGSVTFPDGAKSGLLSVTPVNANKVPMAPPNGMQPQLIVTIQPAGTKFDPPAPLELPNVDGFAPGAQVEMYSYDHDIEEFVTIGLGTVSQDGSLVKSNKGVGVVKAGWHCGSQPGGSGCCAKCGDCQSVDGNCNCVNDPNKPLPNTPGDCKKPGPNGCKDGGKQENDDSDKPEDKPGDCKAPTCKNGTPGTENDDSDAPPDDKCQYCKDGELKKKLDDIPNPETSVSIAWEFPSEVIDNMNKALEVIDRLPGADLQISKPTVTLEGKASNCCDRDTGNVTPGGKKEVSGRGTIGIAGDFLIPWPIPGAALEARVEVDFGWLGSAFMSLDLEGGLFFDIKAEVGGGVKVTEDACNDNEKCTTLDLRGSLVPALDLKLEANACTGYSSFWSGDYEECASLAFKPGRLEWNLCAGLKYQFGQGPSCPTEFTGGFGNGGLKFSFSFTASVKEKTNNTTVQSTGGLKWEFGPLFAGANAGLCN